MNSRSARQRIGEDSDELRMGRQIVRDEANALSNLADRLDANFVDAVQSIVRCQGNVVVLGMGKAGLVGKKIAPIFVSIFTGVLEMKRRKMIVGGQYQKSSF